MNRKISYSFDEENYNGEYNNIDELVKDLLLDSSFEEELENGFVVVSIGENVPYTDKGSDVTNTILDYFYEQAYDKSDYAENYLQDIKKEHLEWFDAKLDSLWEEFKKIIGEQHPFYNVVNFKNYVVYENGDYKEV